jgi:hypothetical protein
MSTPTRSTLTWPRVKVLVTITPTCHRRAHTKLSTSDTCKAQNTVWTRCNSTYLFRMVAQRERRRHEQEDCFRDSETNRRRSLEWKIMNVMIRNEGNGNHSMVYAWILAFRQDSHLMYQLSRCEL